MKRKRKPELDTVLQYDDLKTDAGGTGAGGRGGRGSGTGSGGGGFRAGQNVVCRIVGAEPGGYAVYVEGYGDGFLPTPVVLEVDQKIQALYVCTYNNRALVSARLPRSDH